MALDAVGEQYDGCREEALQAFVHSGLLREELNNSESFLKAWNRNAQQCSKPIDGGIKEHAVALSVYANERDFVTTFDKAVETMRNNVSAYENFPYKSFLFLLTDAMRLLNSSVCKSLYFVPDEEPKLKPGSSVRLGSFKTVYLRITSVGYDLHELTVYNLTSCFFVNLREHGCGKNKNMVLISPAEEFIVEGDFEKTRDDAEYTEVALKHSKVTSFNNCHRFSR